MNPQREHAIHNERPIRIICIGAGPSGLCFAYKLQRSFQNFSLTIYEKNANIGGTWFENTFPGCACDIPAHTYTYTFEPKHDWSSRYATASEIEQYFVDFASKYSLRKYLMLEHKVVGAQWIANSGEWTVQIENLASSRASQSISASCDIMINANGYLNNWKWPDVPGLDVYKGDLLHTASWSQSVQIAGKNVGLIGNGASAIQVLPAIEPIVKNLKTFIRSPTYVWGRQNTMFTPEQVRKFGQDSKAHLDFRKAHERSSNSLFSKYTQDFYFHPALLTVQAGMRQTLGNTYLADRLIPKWAIGCRRLTPGPDYLEALSKEHVQVVFAGVEELTERGCKCDDGVEYPLDVLICATGFDTSFKPRFPIIGQAKINLQDRWSTEPRSYLGIAAPGFPNMFMFLGPQSCLAGNCILPVIEAQADHMLQLIDRYQTENMNCFAPKSQAVEDFISHSNSFLETTVWSDDCRSWYKNHNFARGGSKLWPGSPLHYFEAMKEFRADDWDILYTGNRFAWLGNGFSQTEFDPTSDLGYYITERDESSYASRRKRREVLTKSGSQPVRQLHNFIEAP